MCKTVLGEGTRNADLKTCQIFAWCEPIVYHRSTTLRYSKNVYVGHAKRLSAISAMGICRIICSENIQIVITNFECETRRA